MEKNTYKREAINYFWSIKNCTEILNKLKANDFQASTFSTYHFFYALYYVTARSDLNQLVYLIEDTFRREEGLYLTCNEERAFLLPKNIKI